MTKSINTLKFNRILIIVNIIKATLNLIFKPYCLTNYAVNKGLYLKAIRNCFNVITISIDLYKVDLIIVLK